MKSWIPLFLLLSAPALAGLSVSDTSVAILDQFEGRNLAKSSSNPNNQVAELAKISNEVGARVDGKISLSIFELMARSRFSALYSEVNTMQKWHTSLFFQELYLRGNLHSDFYVTYGRVLYGWGPAEAITPTNWFSPEIQWQPSPFFETLGVYRGQFNWSVGQGFSLVGMHEAPEIRDEWSKGYVREKYRERWLVKAEGNWHNANEIFGMVAGQERVNGQSAHRVGAYGSWTINDGWQIYGDGVVRQKKHRGKSWSTLADGGVRYTFENGPELRTEYIYNQNGADLATEEQQNVLLSSLSLLDLKNLYISHAQTLLTQHYLYMGLRWSNPFFMPSSVQTPSFSLRALHSLSDHSTSLLLATDFGFWDHFTTAFYVAKGLGSRDREMRKIYDAVAGAAVKYSF